MTSNSGHGCFLAAASALALGSALAAAPVSEDEGFFYEDILTGLDVSHELGWMPDDDLSVTALERFTDLLGQSRDGRPIILRVNLSEGIGKGLAPESIDRHAAPFRDALPR